MMIRATAKERFSLDKLEICVKNIEISATSIQAYRKNVTETMNYIRFFRKISTQYLLWFSHEFSHKSNYPSMILHDAPEKKVPRSHEC